MGWLDRKLLQMQRNYHANDRGPRLYGEKLQAWAASAGWTYRAEAPELAGRWFPAVAPGGEGLEDFRFVAEGVSNGRPVVVGTRETYVVTRPRDESNNMDRLSFIAVGLPGRPPEEYLRSPLEAERAIRAMGGFVPEPYDARCTEDGWLLAGRGGFHELKRLPQRVDLLSRQVTMLPPEFWRR